MAYARATIEHGWSRNVLNIHIETGHRRHIQGREECPFSVHPSEGAVTLVAPMGTRLEVARAYAVSKLRWIRQQQAQLQAQSRETHRQFVTRESHYVWGRRYLLSVLERDASPAVKMDHRRITLHVRLGSDAAKREAIYQRWQRGLLHQAITPLIEYWEPRIGVKVNGYFLQRMKTK